MGKYASHHVVVFVADGSSMLGLAIAAEVFGEKPEGVDSWYRLTIATEHPGALRIQPGLRVDVRAGLGAFRSADTIIVAGWSSQVTASEALVRSLRKAHARGARIVSFCTGTFLLAQAGILDGRCATTHWNATERFRTRHPGVGLDPDVLYVDDGEILTSAGSASGFDLAIHLVRLDHGAHVANLVARELVIAPHRQGGQAQFIPTPVPAAGLDDGLGPTLDWIAENLHQDLSLAAMARHANLSTRQFSRRFRDTTGTTPHQWLIRQRLLRAQELLEQTELSVEEVAQRCGFANAAAMRPHFARLLTTSPADYRRCFATEQALNAS